MNQNSFISHVREDGIKVYTRLAFEKMREIGALAALCLDELTALVRPGVTTQDLDNYVMKFAHFHHITPAPFYYRGFPKACCTSVNHVVCHGIPSDKEKLKKGDIINIDVTFISSDGFHGDTSRMYFADEKHTNHHAKHLCQTTYTCMIEGIEIVRPNLHLGDIGFTIAQKAHEEGYDGIVRNFCGHGTGLVFHDKPEVLHYGAKNEGIVLSEGMIFTIEPMLNAGDWRVRILKDGWTAVTKDHRLSAQFEHTLGVTENGYEIFTLPSTNNLSSFTL